ncbi:MAG: biotin/lipoyl-binding protein [Hyphomicrobiales bacterium]|nr:biotin/lipoyl-binding protein [Hyphomicrobiales bacterium]
MSARFASVLIANRGEIACRIIRAARAEGLRAIAAYSDADAEALHARLADAAVRIGPAPAAQSYLSIENLVAAAKAAGAEAVHPGYGFLAESADFAEACAAAGLVFVGPPPRAIRAMADKGAAKARMEAAGVPCAPGYHGPDQSPIRFAEEAERIGYPLMVKACAGGGGRGLRVVRARDELEAALKSARGEAETAFGDGRLLIECALLGARHVEVQILGDERGTIVHLGERDCSIQRRHQKLIEESPSPAVSPALRDAIGAAAVRAAAAVGYVGAGTVEFLLDDSVDAVADRVGRAQRARLQGRFYFLEMNTRIQVEHPVTECVTGLDLVRLQLHVAQGRPLPFRQSDVVLRGHAIEARLYAEDAAAGFLPASGRILSLRLPEGEGVRVDGGVESGSLVPSDYDSLLAKTIAFGADREQARRRLVSALQGVFVAGVPTNRDALVAALEAPEFVAGKATNSFVPTAPGAVAPTLETIALAALLFVQSGGPSEPTASWRASPLRLAADGVEYRAAVRRQGDDWVVSLPSATIALRLLSPTRGEARILSDGVVRHAAHARDADELWLDFDGVCRRFVDLTYAPPTRRNEEADGAVRAPVSGVVVGVEAKAGDRVRRGQTLAIVESMKMHYAIVAPIDGVVAEANAVAGRPAEQRALLFAIRAAGEP